MVEYIKREAAVAVCDEQYKECLRKGDFRGDTVAWDICADIKAIPAADVAPVVRCKDCKHYRNHPNGLCYLHTEPKANVRGYSGKAVCVEPDDFCSYGEQKDGGASNG